MDAELKKKLQERFMENLSNIVTGDDSNDNAESIILQIIDQLKADRSLNDKVRYSDTEGTLLYYVLRFDTQGEDINNKEKRLNSPKLKQIEKVLRDAGIGEWGREVPKEELGEETLEGLRLYAHLDNRQNFSPENL
ncbi:hypothetical protein [Wolbachia endosymbiont of Pentidionis agamae]|uniref:hypothetical protein n=1 Tax=Wolbachia endosymbiont of Pentidionis agamae TaxID=3110435 RepID=UPI002FD2C241